jgi:hypothetical protein
MGLGPPIDWEPPVLTLDGPSVRYVRYGTTLTGTIKDNGKVDRVILRDTVTDEVLFRAKLLSNDRWEIVLNFDESRNGDKILGQIIGYDTFGNSGDMSMASITLHIDIGPPYVEDIWIQRTEVRRAYLQKIYDLRALETSDPKGEWLSQVDMYQNGVFWIDARIGEDETLIENTFPKAYIYDESHPNTPIFSTGTEREPGSTVYNPRFKFDEAAILAAGEIAFGSGYTAGYNNGERYYYRIEIIAEDSSGNKNTVEQLDYFCMWKTADMPKGILDPVMGLEQPITLPKGSQLPIVFFDDDTLEYAFAALLTQDQWNGTKPIADNDIFIPQDTTNEQKLAYLTKRLITDKNVVYDWKYDKHETKEEVINQVPNNGTMDYQFYYISTGNSETDYGYYMLFTVVKDKKLAPHDTNNTALNLTSARSWLINVIDENAPLIIFDKTNGCPEENTFPEDLTGGKSFEIVGYTLRENGSDENEGSVPGQGNRVTFFRMAWIPYGISGGADSYVKQVRAALELRDPQDSNFPPGVQWWTLNDERAGANVDGKPALNSWVDTGNTPLSTGKYRKQTFKKSFDVTGGQDDLKTAYNNFRYGSGSNNLENRTKLFLFYAEDNMGHVVHSQLYLLGQTSPPEINIYDLTDISMGLKPPDINEDINLITSPDGTITNAVRTAYQAKLDEFNGRPAIYTTIADKVPGTPGNPGSLASYEMATLRAYPRDTTTTFWVTAKGGGNMALESIRMEDITSAISARDVGHFDSGNGVLSYIEFLPEVTQRTFRFTATDVLGNTKSIQRTVMITNAALLTEITTKTQDGEYGIGTLITLEARFSGMVYWTGANPRLNIRYHNPSGTVTYESIDTTTSENAPTLFLSFPFTVGINYGGKLETMYTATGMGGSPSDQRPITIPQNSSIMDNDRKEAAFVPSYSTGFNWLDATGSLQGTTTNPGKTINLNGIRPRSNGNIAISGKNAHSTGPWYFKSGETIEFTLSSEDTSANNRIMPGGGGNPRIQFTVGSSPTLRYANWQRSANNGQAMVFSVPVTTALGDGQIGSLALNTVEGTVVNSVGNRLIYIANDSDVSALFLGSSIVRIDQTPPLMPTVTLNGSATINDTYSSTPTLVITTPPTTASEPWGVDTTEYSLDNGFNWETYPTPRAGWTALVDGALRIQTGKWIMRTRHVDRAGNIGATTNHPFSVNDKFPDLLSITAVQPNGIYKEGANLEFTLTFSDSVYTRTANNVTIRLTDWNSNTSGGTDTDERILTATAVTQANASNTISFRWNNITDKEMLNGLYISAVNLEYLSDLYGNYGGTGTAATANNHLLTITKAGGTINTCANLNGAGIIVDCIAPKLDLMTPANAQGTTAGNRANSVMAPGNRTITLTFSEPVQAGTGTITIKPHGSYNIPPVFENDSYYLDVTTGNRSTTPQSGYTRITGFYDIYNNSALTSANRTALTAGTNMTNGLTLDTRTGQSEGPYIKMTQGLKRGAGYSGNYNNGMDTVQYNNSTAHGPNVDVTKSGNEFIYMVPDTTTKWVLDYRYSINNTQNTQVVPVTNGNPTLATPETSVVANIRTALNAAKFRWQEIDVTASSITYSADRKIVTITLPEPLENGIQWDIVYPAGTFTDMAGHNAPVITDGSTWFISRGAQIPVIRVNRKSFDARTSGTWRNTGQAYAVPSDRGVPGGWGIGDFNRVHYRIETETLDATLSYLTINNAKAANNGNSASIYITTAEITQTNGGDSWAVAVPGGGGTNLSGDSWNTTTATRGTMVRPNLIRRATTNTPNNWSVTDENNVMTTRSFQGTHRGFKSYNKDALASELSGGTLTLLTTAQAPNNGPVSSGTALYFEYYSTEACKNYVMATASINHGTGAEFTSSRGYEGVYRSVVALLQTNTNSNAAHYVEGSNVKNGMPSIAGFPVRDAEETGDNRFIKYFYQSTTQTRQFLWVSTEIVSEWYFIKYGNGGTHMNSGDVNNYLIAGYGDLTFGFQVTSD